MTDITKMQEMLNWKLLSGSHKFPGPDGGTCINEAAIVAAGFEYKRVVSPHDLPECFCKTLGGLLIRLNDSLDNKNRQKLIKYIPILPGSKVFFAISHTYTMEINRMVKTKAIEFLRNLDIMDEDFSNIPSCSPLDILDRLCFSTEKLCHRIENGNLFTIPYDTIPSFKKYEYGGDTIQIPVLPSPPSIQRHRALEVAKIREERSLLFLEMADEAVKINLRYRDNPPAEVETVMNNINEFRKKNNLETV